LTFESNSFNKKNKKNAIFQAKYGIHIFEEIFFLASTTGSVKSDLFLKKVANIVAGNAHQSL